MPGVSHTKSMNKPYTHLDGRTLESCHFDPDTHQWVFIFSGPVALQVSAPWRVVCQGQIYLGYQDDGHLFGLTKPLNAVQRLEAVIIGRQVEAANLSATADLAVIFQGASTLEIFNSSGGYEGWQMNGPSKRWVVGMGGGAVSETRDDG
jgi:hypothetical protein